jgi:parallel beta-helix repeat protein
VGREDLDDAGSQDPPVRAPDRQPPSIIQVGCASHGRGDVWVVLKYCPQICEYRKVAWQRRRVFVMRRRHALKEDTSTHRVPMDSERIKPRPRNAHSMRGGRGSLVLRAVLVLVLVGASLMSLGPPSAAAASPPKAFAVLDPILIDGDANFTGANGVTRGTGVEGDPYIIEGWDIDATAAHGIWIRLTFAFFTIRDLRVQSGDPNHSGIYLEQVENGRIDNVTAEANLDGIRVEGSKHITITSSNVRSSQRSGIMIAHSLDIRVERNAVTGGAEAGISAIYAADSSILSNQVSNSSIGIQVLADRVTVSRNIARGNGIGIHIDRSTGVVSYNTAAQNSDMGIYAGYSNLSLVWNEFSQNARYGLYSYRLEGEIHHNRFFENEKGWDFDIRFWDAGYAVGGNWWHSYRSMDRCSGPNQDVCPNPDGVGDTPAWVEGGSRDRYPRLQPSQPPTARFAMTPTAPTEQEPVRFDASASTDADGSIAEVLWDFGLGLSGTGMVVVHTFPAAGTYPLRLIVIDNASRVDEKVFDVVVATLELVPYEGSGFRVPVPKLWELRENVSLGGQIAELQVLGPVRQGVQTSIVLETDRDPTAREDVAYLNSAMDEVVRELRQQRPSYELVEGPLHRTIAGHLSVTFRVEFDLDVGKSVSQTIVIIVSDAHDRYWGFILTSFADYYGTDARTFERMLAGFVITRVPPPSEPTVTPGVTLSGIPLFLLLGGGIVVAVLVVVLVAALLTRRRKPMYPLPPSLTPWSPPAGPAPWTPPPGTVPRFCTSCGSPIPIGASFCGRCGVALPPPPPTT